MPTISRFDSESSSLPRNAKLVVTRRNGNQAFQALLRNDLVELKLDDIVEPGNNGAGIGGGCEKDRWVGIKGCAGRRLHACARTDEADDCAA
jgi:hypothetical protein